MKLIKAPECCAGESQPPRKETLATQLIAGSSDAIISEALDGTVLTWNAAAEQMFGFSAAEMIENPTTHLLPVERMQEEQLLVAKLLAGEKVPHFETKRVRKDGATIDVSITLSPIRDRRGKILAISKILRDVTDQLHERSRHALASAIIEDSDDAIIAKTVDGTILSWNAGAERVFGYSAAEMIGNASARLLPVDRTQEELVLVAKLLIGRQVHNFETRRVRKDGTIVEVSMTVSPICEDSGKMLAFSEIFRDVISPRAQARREHASDTDVTEHPESAVAEKTTCDPIPG